jgi:hypothetical protein
MMLLKSSSFSRRGTPGILRSSRERRCACSWRGRVAQFLGTVDRLSCSLRSSAIASTAVPFVRLDLTVPSLSMALPHSMK